MSHGPTAPASSGPTGDADAPWGTEHVLSAQHDTDNGRPALYVTRSAQLCIGTVTDGSDPINPLVCRSFERLPGQGFTVGFTFSQFGNLPQDRPAHVIVAGLLRGDVTRVVIRTPRGDLEAHTAVATDPAMGTLYWVETPVTFTPSRDVGSITRIAFQGATPLFQCTDEECTPE